MGVRAIDKYTAWHYVWGCTAYAAVSPLTDSIGQFGAFIAANAIHLLSEWNENDRDPDGTVLESTRNHIADQVAFATGWISVWAAVCVYGGCPDPIHSAPFVFLVCSIWFWGTLCVEVGKEIAARREWSGRSEARSAEP